MGCIKHCARLNGSMEATKSSNRMQRLAQVSLIAFILLGVETIFATCLRWKVFYSQKGLKFLDGSGHEISKATVLGHDFQHLQNFYALIIIGIILAAILRRKHRLFLVVVICGLSCFLLWFSHSLPAIWHSYDGILPVMQEIIFSLNRSRTCNLAHVFSLMWIMFFSPMFKLVCLGTIIITGVVCITSTLRNKSIA